MKRVIGIDPGLLGGIVALDVNGDDVQVVLALGTPLAIAMRKRKPCNEYDIRSMHTVLKELVEGAVGRCLVVLERSSTRPGQAAQAVLRTGEGFGLWRGLIAGFDVEIMQIQPQTWKRKQNLLHADKRASVLRAKDKFPALARLTVGQHGIAEAALIAATGAGC